MEELDSRYDPLALLQLIMYSREDETCFIKTTVLASSLR